MTIRFKFDARKSLQAIHFLATKAPGITQYYVGKVLFFADREHLLDWGRPISGDRYVAMPHGPVPSYVYDFLKDTPGEPDEFADELSTRVEIASSGNKRHVYPKGEADFDLLSETDKEYLSQALSAYGSMSFGQLRELSHQDPAYIAAWEKDGLNNEMDIRLWLGELDDKATAEAQLVERSVIDRRVYRKTAA